SRSLDGMVDRSPDRPGRRRDFSDRLTAPLPGPRDVLRMLRQMPPAQELLAGAAAIPVAPAGLPPLAGDRAAVTWVGHATFVIRLGGLTVLTDPVWSRRIPGVPPRVTPVGLPWEDLPPVDAAAAPGGPGPPPPPSSSASVGGRS